MNNDNNFDEDWDPNAGYDHNGMLAKDEEELKFLQEQERVLLSQSQHAEDFMAEVDELMGGATIPPDMFNSEGILTSLGLDPQYKHLSVDSDQNMDETHAHDYVGDSEDDSSDPDEIQEESSSSAESDEECDEKEYGNDHDSERDDQSSRRTELIQDSIPSNLSDRDHNGLTNEQYNDSELVRSIQKVAANINTSPKNGITSTANILKSSKKNLDRSFLNHDTSLTATGGEPEQST